MKICRVIIFFALTLVVCSPTQSVADTKKLGKILTDIGGGGGNSKPKPKSPDTPDGGNPRVRPNPGIGGGGAGNAPDVPDIDAEDLRESREIANEGWEFLKPPPPIRVDEKMVRKAMENAPLKSQQGLGGVSLPKIQEYVDRLRKGEKPPKIKVHNGIIVDGNHRYIAGKIFGQEPEVQDWIGGRPDRVVDWSEIPLSLENWD